MNTDKTTCVCGRPFHRHDTLNVVVDALSNGCKKFTPAPTQSEASEPAEGEEPSREQAIDDAWRRFVKMYHPGDEQVPAIEQDAIRQGFDAGIKWFTDGVDFKEAQAMLRGAIEEMSKPAASQQAPADHPDLVSEARTHLILGKGDEIIVVTKRQDGNGDNITDSMSLMGYIQNAVMGGADIDRYRKALKNLSRELYEV